METWIQLGRGPLFRIALSLLVLGLLRQVFLILADLVDAFRRSAARAAFCRETVRQLVGRFRPSRGLWRQRPVRGILSVLFHMGLLVTPLFLAAHALLWKQTTGVPWPALPQQLANYLTLLALATGVGLFLGRLAHSAARRLSRPQDFLWPLLLLVPFLTGYVCANVAIGARLYRQLMLIHVYSADVIMFLVPFTKIAHCVLSPLSQLVTGAAWQIAPGSGDLVAAALEAKNRPGGEQDRRSEFSSAVLTDEAHAQ